MKIKLTKAIKHKGQDISVLDLPLEDLTGNDLIDIEKQLARSGEASTIMEFNRVYLVSVASRAAHIPAETLKSASAKDFTRITNEVRGFLMLSASGEIEEDTESEIPAKPLETYSEGLQSDLPERTQEHL